MNRVFILGAGFSKAVNDVMPVLSELTNGVTSTLRGWGVEVGEDLEAIADVEQWLSFLGDPAPWLGSSEQGRKYALFADVSRAIYEVLSAMEKTASVQPAPPWLLTLVEYWQRTLATVVTFNYDCLVELAFLEIMSKVGIYWASDLYAIPISPAAQRVGGPARQRMSAFKLLKLHGSLSWWYSGPDAEQSDPIYWTGWRGRFGEGTQDLWPEFGAESLVVDKVPMLVPPAATKTPFYKNRLLAAQWAQAAEALQNAEELVLMGYSAPITDLTVTTLIATEFKGNTIVPVNLDKTIINRAKNLGDRRRDLEVIDEYLGADCLEKWTNMFAS
jgi:hypothetical protein